ncbi:Uncharacterised protein [Mycobacteroides abscessus subsp. abscessus]|nr:Uncharacterised protein [Mycobacteroides abscessus subsp. abscessus]
MLNLLIGLTAYLIKSEFLEFIVLLLSINICFLIIPTYLSSIFSYKFDPYSMYKFSNILIYTIIFILVFESIITNLAYLGLDINLFLSTVLTIIIPCLISSIAIIFVKPSILHVLITVAFNVFYYIIYSLYIMNLDGYLEYVSKYNIDNNDINIQVSPNMLEISQVIFLILAYLIPQLFIIFIKFKKGEKNVRI